MLDRAYNSVGNSLEASNEILDRCAGLDGAGYARVKLVAKGRSHVKGLNTSADQTG
jgi:hypothetical protein